MATRCGTSAIGENDAWPKRLYWRLARNYRRDSPAFALTSLGNSLLLRIKGERAQGTIIGWQSCGRNANCPVAFFTDKSGKQRQVVSSVGFKLSSRGLARMAFQEGDNISLAYPSGCPEKAEFIWTGSLLLSIFSALLAATVASVGIWIIRLDRRELGADS